MRPTTRVPAAARRPLHSRLSHSLDTRRRQRLRLVLTVLATAIVLGGLIRLATNDEVVEVVSFEEPWNAEGLNPAAARGALAPLGGAKTRLANADGPVE